MDGSVDLVAVPHKDPVDDALPATLLEPLTPIESDGAVVNERDAHGDVDKNGVAEELDKIVARLGDATGEVDTNTMLVTLIWPL